MKKGVFLLFIFVRTSVPLFAQYQRHDDMGEYSHSIGVSYLSANHQSNDFEIHNSYAALVYNLRIDLKLSFHSSLGAALYPTFGYAVNTKVKAYNHNANMPTVSSEPPFCFEIPVLIQYNSGNHSTRHTRYKFGSFVGAGVCYSSYSESKITFDEEKNASISSGTYLSFCANAGIKFMIKNKSYGIRVYYSKPIRMQYSVIGHNFGISVLYNFATHSRFG